LNHPNAVSTALIATAQKHCEYCGEDMIIYKERIYRLKQTTSFKTYQGWYSWLINDWIINQPDKDLLMRMFIELDFDPLKFVDIVVNGKSNNK
jgi:hypothetical protein